MSTLTLLHAEKDHLGYGRMGLSLRAALERQGVVVVPRNVEPHTNVVCHATIPSSATRWWGGQFSVLWSMWETNDLPPGFAESLHAHDMILVPSQMCADVYGQHHPDVRLVQLGIDPVRWSPVRREVRDRFVFLTGGSNPLRKGVDVVVETFLRMFGGWSPEQGGPEPVLVVKCPHGYPVSHPQVQVITGYLSVQQEVDLYGSAHCFVGASRGEGFGLMPLQAMAQACPTIVVDAHGYREFAHLAGWQLGWSWRDADLSQWGRCGEWWEPDRGDLEEAMWDAYTNHERASAHAYAMSTLVRAGHTWDCAADGMVDAIGRDRLVGYQGDGTAFVAEPLVYLAQVNRRLVCDIGPGSYTFVPDTDYWVSADVRRVLMDAGYLTDEARVEKFGRHVEAVGVS